MRSTVMPITVDGVGVGTIEAGYSDEVSDIPTGSSATPDDKPLNAQSGEGHAGGGSHHGGTGSSSGGHHDEGVHHPHHHGHYGPTFRGTRHRVVKDAPTEEAGPRVEGKPTKRKPRGTEGPPSETPAEPPKHEIGPTKKKSDTPQTEKPTTEKPPQSAPAPGEHDKGAGSGHETGKGNEADSGRATGPSAGPGEHIETLPPIGPGARQREQDRAADRADARDKQMSGSGKEPTFRPGLTPRGAAPAAPPEKFTVADVKQAAENGLGKGRIDRGQFREEVNNPAIVKKLAWMVAGEVEGNASNRARIVQLETVFNRSAYRGHNLARGLLSVTENPSLGYYAGSRAPGGGTYAPSKEPTAEQIETFKRDILAPVMSGSNLSDNGSGPLTGNASGSVAAHQIANGTPYRADLRAEGGDTYFREGPFTYPLRRLPGIGVTRLPAGPMPKGEPTFANIPYGDTKYLDRYGGHSTLGWPPRTGPVGQGMGFSQEFARRLAEAGRAYQAETGADPTYGEGDRDIGTQTHYWEESHHGRDYAAAPPGRSNHQRGEAMDIPAGAFRDWLYRNGRRFGLRFPYRNDAPHIQRVEVP